MKYLRFFIYFLLSILINSAELGAQSELPEIGATCNDPSIECLWVTNQNTAWRISNVTLTPSEIETPENWWDEARFQEHLWATFQPELIPSLSDFAAAASMLAPDFVSDEATLYISFDRSINRTIRTVSCMPGTWTIVSTQSVLVDDNSGWIRVEPVPIRVYEMDIVQSLLEAYLYQLLSQPGSSTQPVNSCIWVSSSHGVAQ